jgi:cytochrome c-type biogenesis protein CcmH
MAKPDTVSLDPPQEKRYKGLAEELRCLVCQNQNLADSHADLAMDLKVQVREQIAAGKTDQQIRDYMVQRYGDFVLYKPPVQGNTFALWAGPFALLAVGAVVAWRVQRATRAKAAITGQPQDKSGALAKARADLEP